MPFLDFLTGSNPTSQQFQKFTPQQLGVKGAAGNQALQLLQSLGGGSNFEPIAQQARNRFQTQTIPGIAERFTSLGQGAQRSSGFQNSLGQAGAGLEQGLASLQSQHGLQERGMDQSLLQMLLGTSLQPESETLINPGQSGLLQELVPVLGKLLPLLLGGGLQSLLSFLGGNNGQSS